MAFRHLHLNIYFIQSIIKHPNVTCYAFQFFLFSIAKVKKNKLKTHMLMYFSLPAQMCVAMWASICVCTVYSCHTAGPQKY